ncbi:hypothetical protein I8752_28775 [Nostocaceae cyanobacterium CENA369]|uniref:Uncharacterized protein n=1 Tax=Dendronalium phyllosphericum CENA369 TaxID=1725256 RepID=A0A8J7LM57_9NOST|nr:hypothetical protein [Dendronalium phyllosphericum]MBH8576909.1 hypothetical protein [Dendronalium phyllosphericum CENA369]
MPHPDETSLIRDLEDNFGDEVVQQFKNCIQYAKFWRQYQNLQQGSSDAFSNVMNNSGCNANLTRITDEIMRKRAFNCLNYYKKYRT